VSPITRREKEATVGGTKSRVAILLVATLSSGLGAAVGCGVQAPMERSGNRRGEGGVNPGPWITTRMPRA
jgi:hypothetical protein